MNCPEHKDSSLDEDHQVHMKTRVVVLLSLLVAALLLVLWSPWEPPAEGGSPIIRSDQEATRAALAFLSRLHLQDNRNDMSKPVSISTDRLKSTKYWRIAWAAKVDPSVTNQLEILVDEYGYLQLFPYFQGHIHASDIYTNQVYYLEYYERRKMDSNPRL